MKILITVLLLGFITSCTTSSKCTKDVKQEKTTKCCKH